LQKAKRPIESRSLGIINFYINGKNTN